MLFLDGQQKTAFWKNSGGILDDKPAREGGVDPSLTARSTRASTGSLVLGQVGGIDRGMDMAQVPGGSRWLYCCCACRP
jgi:hypothetical protein